MEIWMEKSIELVRNSFENLDNIDYKDLIYVFYDHFSNRNLARFIAYLYNKDETILLFEIDDVMANKKYNLDKAEKIAARLKKNGFDAWAELD